MRRSVRATANRRNAHSSTGPKTAAGKSRVAKNAFRHGLAIPPGLDPGLSTEIDRLAVVLAGERAEPARLEAARRIAEAQIDLLRVRQARYTLFADRSRARSSIVRDDNPPSGRAATEASAPGSSAPPDWTAEGSVPPIGEGVEAIATGLARLDRYERRALSRRKAAVREFDTLTSQSRFRRD